MVTAQLGSHAGQRLPRGQHSSTAAGWQPTQGFLSIFFVSPFPRHSLSLPDLLTVLSPSPTLPILLAPYRLFAVSSLTALLPARGTPGCRSSRSLHSPRPHQGRSSGAEGMNRNQPSARASLTPRAPGQAWVSPCPQQERTFWLPAACEGAPGGGALFLLAWGLRAALM